MDARGLLRRLAELIATLVVASFIIFSALHLAPGDPAAALSGSGKVTPAQLEAIRQEYHLDDPLFVSYGRWFAAAIQGDFGQSLYFKEPVSHLLGPRLGVTVTLVAYAMLLTLVLGVGMGIVAALRGGRVDTTILVGTTAAMGAPTFVVAVGLIALFATDLGWFPVFGSGSGLGDRLWHLTLPAVSLACAQVAYVTQIVRASVREEMGSEYVETAQSRGIPQLKIIRRHVLRNVMGPIATVGGLTFAATLAGIAVVETAFGINGIGALLVESAQKRDFAIVLAIALIMVAAFVVVSTLVDILAATLDPRLARRSVR